MGARGKPRVTTLDQEDEIIAWICDCALSSNDPDCKEQFLSIMC